MRIGTRYAIALGFGLATAGFAALTFTDATWGYAVFVIPLIGIAIGLGLANGPASSASTSAVANDQVGQASGISNMARYVGGSLAVAAAATIFSAVTERQTEAGLATADALATGLARAALFLTIMSAAGVALALFVGPHRPAKPRAVDLSAAAASSTHTIPTPSIGLTRRVARSRPPARPAMAQGDSPVADGSADAASGFHRKPPTAENVSRLGAPLRRSSWQ